MFQMPKHAQPFVGSQHVQTHGHDHGQEQEGRDHEETSIATSTKPAVSFNIFFARVMQSKDSWTLIFQLLLNWAFAVFKVLPLVFIQRGILFVCVICAYKTPRFWEAARSNLLVADRIFVMCSNVLLPNFFPLYKVSVETTLLKFISQGSKLS